MKGLTGAAKLVSIPKKPTLASRFFHIWRKRLIPKASDLNAELQVTISLFVKKHPHGCFFYTFTHFHLETLCLSQSSKYLRNQRR
ncbi:hypothetical protein P3620_25590, partial [Vibrio parahaemolyticus]|nr:hypothetical protein [Vibrio parahaemolyticus]